MCFFCTVVLVWDIWKSSIEMLHSSLVPCYTLLKPVSGALTLSYCHQKAQSKFLKLHPTCRPTQGCPVAPTDSDSQPVSPVTCHAHTWWHAPERRQRSNALGPDGEWFVLGSVPPIAWTDTVQDHCYIRNLRTGFSLCHHKQTPLTQRLHGILWRTRRKTSPEVKPQRGSRQVGWKCMYPQCTLCMLGLIRLTVQEGCCFFFYY